MRGVLLIGIVWLAIGAGCWGQQAADNRHVAVLLMELHSQDWTQRSTAFEALRSDSLALRNPEVRAALLDLLDRENQELDAELLQAQKARNSASEDKSDEGDAADEAYAEYYSQVLDTVDSFADWNDPRQACILVNAGSSPDSAFAEEVASHGKTTIPCLLQRARSEVNLKRAVAVPVLVQALAKQKDALDSRTIETGRQVILNALRDPDETVRSFTVLAIGNFGERDTIPVLKNVADTDPAFSQERNTYWIRVEAANAISAIEKRTGVQR